MKLKMTVGLLGLVLAGPGYADCKDGGKTCVDNIYKSEKNGRFKRTQSGSLLDSGLPNSQSIERNVDLSGYAKTSYVNSGISSSEQRQTDLLNNHVGVLNGEIAHLHHKIDNLKVSGGGGGGWQAMTSSLGMGQSVPIPAEATKIRIVSRSGQQHERDIRPGQHINIFSEASSYVHSNGLGGDCAYVQKWVKFEGNKVTTEVEYKHTPTLWCNGHSITGQRTWVRGVSTGLVSAYIPASGGGSSVDLGPLNTKVASLEGNVGTLNTDMNTTKSNVVRIDSEIQRILERLDNLTVDLYEEDMNACNAKGTVTISHSPAEQCKDGSRTTESYSWNSTTNQCDATRSTTRLKMWGNKSACSGGGNNK
ncbi:hypothetical protein [Vibrio barjaei]|uniref:hypothetical protein n=1 Tax=Vibrio barjaei TaxID=1676683 RepID=UPI002283ED5E|nr:hypothetical protein [Vibrio barjaei]MCY9870374.1 hypothetical protein [Vibrio barjaei]